MVLAHSRSHGDRAVHAPPMPRACSKAAIRNPNPVIFLENEILYGHSSPVPKLDDYVLPIGKARIARAGQGRHASSPSRSGMTYALKAAEELAKENIDAEVIDLRTLRPMDTETIIASVKKTGRAVTRRGGLAAVRRRRRDRRACHGRGLRLSRRAGRARVRQGRADALCRQSREKLALPSVAEVVERCSAQPVIRLFLRAYPRAARSPRADA